MTFTNPTLRVLGGLATIASARATLTMTKVGGYANPNEGEGPLEIVVVKPSTNVSARYKQCQVPGIRCQVYRIVYPCMTRKTTQNFSLMNFLDNGEIDGKRRAMGCTDRSLRDIFPYDPSFVGCASPNSFRTAVPFWVHITWDLSGSSPRTGVQF